MKVAAKESMTTVHSVRMQAVSTGSFATSNFKRGAIFCGDKGPVKERLPGVTASTTDMISPIVLLAQISVAFAVIGLLALMPPSRGSVLAIPLSGDPVLPWLVQRGDLRLLGAGRLPGSFILFREKAPSFTDALAHHVLLLRALPSLCTTQSIEE